MDVVVESVIISFFIGSILGGVLAFHMSSMRTDRK